MPYCANIVMVKYGQSHGFLCNTEVTQRVIEIRVPPPKRVPCGFLATCHLLTLGATRRYPELRGFPPFVIDPKLLMNSTIC